jgi:hypothetical protein
MHEWGLNQIKILNRNLCDSLSSWYVAKIIISDRSNFVWWWLYFILLLKILLLCCYCYIVLRNMLGPKLDGQNEKNIYYLLLKFKRLYNKVYEIIIIKYMKLLLLIN